jgi:hypothetical protein
VTVRKTDTVQHLRFAAAAAVGCEPERVLLAECAACSSPPLSLC